MNEPWSGVVATFANRHSINRQQKWPLNYILVVGGDVLRFVLSDSLPPTTTRCGEGCSCRSVGWLVRGCPFCLGVEGENGVRKVVAGGQFGFVWLVLLSP